MIIKTECIEDKLEHLSYYIVNLNLLRENDELRYINVNVYISYTHNWVMHYYLSVNTAK